MSRDDLIALVERVFNGEGHTENGNYLVDRVEEAIPNGDVSDLIFWPKQPMTPEEIVDEALRRSADWRRIRL